MKQVSPGERQKAAALMSPFFHPIRLESDSIVDGITMALPFLHGVLLDLGCGSMPYAGLVRERVSEYFSTDMRPNAASPPSVCSDSLHLPFKAESFDSILCTQVLEHVTDPFRMMSEVSRILKKSGHVVLTMPALWPLHEEPYDYFRYTKYALERFAVLNNLHIVQISERGGGIMAIGQLVGALLYDVSGKRAITRIPVKILVAPFLSLCKLLDRMFYYPKLTLGYVLIAQKNGQL